MKERHHDGTLRWILNGKRHKLAIAQSALSDGQFMALAVQNPSQGPVVVSFFHQRMGAATSVTLPSGARIMDELSALLNGLNLQAGDVITVNSTSAVQILGMTGDD